MASPAEVKSNIALLEETVPNDVWRGFKEAGLLAGDVPIVPRGGGASL